MKSFAVVLALVLFSSSFNASHAAPQTGWSPVILPTGTYRDRIKAMPVEQRPGRPLHVYGNTVRLLRTPSASTGSRRPVRQVFLGTPELRSVRTGR